LDNKIMLTIGVILLIGVIGTINQLLNELKRISKTVDKIAKQIGVNDPVPENLINELKSLVSEGKKIEAIKRYRKATGLGLKESKEYIDSLVNMKE